MTKLIRGASEGCDSAPGLGFIMLRSLWLSRTVCMLFDAFLDDSQEDAFGDDVKIEN